MHTVFVYGSLLRGLPNHPVLTDFDARFIDSGRTAESDHTMFAVAGGWYPAIIESPSDSPVIGEVYQVTAEGLAALDRLEGYPSHYTRKLVDIVLAGGETVRAWVYYQHHRKTYYTGYGARGSNVPVPGNDWRSAVQRRG